MRLLMLSKAEHLLLVELLERAPDKYPLANKTALDKLLKLARTAPTTPVPALSASYGLYLPAKDDWLRTETGSILRFTDSLTAYAVLHHHRFTDSTRADLQSAAYLAFVPAEAR